MKKIGSKLVPVLLLLLLAVFKNSDPTRRVRDIRVKRLRRITTEKNDDAFFFKTPLSRVDIRRPRRSACGGRTTDSAANHMRVLRRSFGAPLIVTNRRDRCIFLILSVFSPEHDTCFVCVCARARAKQSVKLDVTPSHKVARLYGPVLFRATALELRKRQGRI